MRSRRGTILAVAVAAVAGLGIWNCSAKTIIVSTDCKDPNADFCSIQEAIDDAVAYDTIIIKPGIFYENINFNGKNITITSANPNDVNLIESTIIDGNGVGNVVTFIHLEDESSVLLGLTIRNGEKGIYCHQSKPLIEKCIVTGNGVGIEGHAYSARPSIVDTIIENNQGDGVVSCYGPIRRCLLRANGGFGIRDCKEMANCIISGNMNGGIGVSPVGVIANCVVVGNRGDGLISTSGDCWPAVVTNSIIADNWGAGLSGSCTFSRYNNVWRNREGNYKHQAHSDWDIHENPLFARDAYWDDNGTPLDSSDDFWVEGEYHLRSAVGRWDPETGSWVTDDVNSPCIDAGDPTSPVGEEPFPNGGKVNQGAYGATVEASKSGGPACTRYPTMDFNKDCKVDYEDFAAFSDGWLECNLVPQSACWE